jgi:hypothetical protein
MGKSDNLLIAAAVVGGAYLLSKTLPSMAHAAAAGTTERVLDRSEKVVREYIEMPGQVFTEVIQLPGREIERYYERHGQIEPSQRAENERKISGATWDLNDPKVLQQKGIVPVTTATGAVRYEPQAPPIPYSPTGYDNMAEEARQVREAQIAERQAQEKEAYYASLRATERDNYYAALNQTRLQTPQGSIAYASSQAWQMLKNTPTQPFGLLARLF